jgi:hypothetical protein
MYTNQANYLFHKVSVFTARRQVIATAIQAANRVSDSDLVSKTIDQLVEWIASDNCIHVPCLDLAAIEYNTTKLKVTRRNVFGEDYQAEEVRFTFEVPFTGTADLFYVQPNTHNGVQPTGKVHGNKVILDVQGIDDPAQVDAQFKGKLREVQQYLEWQVQSWTGYEAELRQAIQYRLAERKAQAERLSGTETGLSALGFKRKGQ